MKKENYKKNLIKNIKKIRLMNKYSLSNMAKILNISENDLQLIEKGKKSISLDLFINICNIFNYNADSLISN